MITNTLTKNRSRQKPAAATPVPARNEGPARLQGQDLRRAPEGLRDTKSERRVQELKKVISESICGATESQRLTTSGRRVVGHAPLVVAQCDVHEHIAQRSFKADHQSLDIFAGLIGFFARKQQRRMHPEVEALVI